MANPVLEENMERLIRRCVPRVTEEQTKRAFTRLADEKR